MIFGAGNLTWGPFWPPALLGKGVTRLIREEVMSIASEIGR